MQLEGILETSIEADVSGEQTGALSGTKALGQGEFLKLLITKLQNQDPLDPQDDLEFIGQLAQFSGLEQLMDVNSNLLAVLEQQRELSTARFLEFLGREVLVLDDTFTVEDGEIPSIGYELPSAASELVVNILDESGGTVFTITDAPRTAGKHEIDLAGGDAEELSLADGTYTFSIIALDLEGESLAASPYVQAEVTGVRFAEDGTIRLLLGQDEIGLSDVSTVLQMSQASEPVE